MTSKTETTITIERTRIELVPVNSRKVTGYQIRDKANNWSPAHNTWGTVTFTASKAVALSYVRANVEGEPLRYVVTLVELFQLKNGKLAKTNIVQELPIAEKLK